MILPFIAPVLVALVFVFVIFICLLMALTEGAMWLLAVIWRAVRTVLIHIFAGTLGALAAHRYQRQQIKEIHALGRGVSLRVRDTRHLHWAILFAVVAIALFLGGRLDWFAWSLP